MVDCHLPHLFSHSDSSTIIFVGRFFLRILTYIPNLDIGRGKFGNKSTNDKQIEHHQFLTEELQELQEVSDKGEVKTTLGGKPVVLDLCALFCWW